MFRYLWTRLAGKELVLLGARGTGKTAMFNAIKVKLDVGAAAQSIAPSGGVEVTKSPVCFKHGDTWIMLKHMRDAPGSENNRGDWEEEFKKSAIVFYLLRADKLFDKDEDTKERIKRDMSFISKWDLNHKEKYRKNKTVVIIGTHFDRHSNYSDFMTNESKYIEEFDECLRGFIYTNRVLGSLRSKEEQNKLIKKALGFI